MIEINGVYTKKDILLANRISLKYTNSFQIAKSIMIFSAFCSLLSIVKYPKNICFWLFFILSILFIIFSHTVLPILSRKYFREHTQALGNNSLSITSDKITSQNAVDTHTWTWLHHIIVTKKMILLFNTPNTFYILPRRWFINNQQFKETLELLKRFPVGEKNNLPTTQSTGPNPPPSASF